MGKISAKGDSYYGNVAANYQIRRAKQSWWQVEQTEMKGLLHALPKGLSVLDVPFGTGRFAPLYMRRKFEVYGVDVSSDMLLAAKDTLGETFDACKTTTGSATDLPYRDESFDLVVSVRFLRDIIVKSDAETALSEFARVTKKYAILQLGQSISKGINLSALDDDIPLLSQLDALGNKQLLAKHGFKIVDSKRVKSDPADNSEIYHFLCEKA
jgi:ubiquinone/menaquinone biosynthesis C-methylase UbiE